MSDPGFDTYVICATPRTGSTLLCGLLESSGVAGHPASYFNRRGLHDYATSWQPARPRDGRIDPEWHRWFATHDLTPAEVVYEELAADPIGTARSTLQQLGLDVVAGRLRIGHQRQADQVNADWVARFTPGE